MDKLNFGTAGIPLSTPNRGTVSGIKYLRELGLNAMEIEFVRFVNILERNTAEIKDAAKKNEIELTCHGQYYINLNSEDSVKIEESKQRIFNAAKIAALCGASSMTFHAAYYMHQDSEKVYQTVKTGMKQIVQQLQDQGIKIWLRPETMGKHSQWGDLKEIIQLSQEVEGVLPCIDFSHLHARATGKSNSYDEFKQIFTLVENKLGRDVLENMHMHLSGIEYNDKGERWHLNLAQSDFRYLELLKAMKEFKVKGVIICESPNNEQDAILLRNNYRLM